MTPNKKRTLKKVKKIQLKLKQNNTNTFFFSWNMCDGYTHFHRPPERYCDIKLSRSIKEIWFRTHKTKIAKLVTRDERTKEGEVDRNPPSLVPRYPCKSLVEKKVFTFKKIFPGSRGQLQCDKGILGRVSSKIWVDRPVVCEGEV